jgi:hypothetical protein
MLDHLVKIQKQSAFEEVDQPEPEPKKRTMTVSMLIEGLDTH